MISNKKNQIDNSNNNKKHQDRIIRMLSKYGDIKENLEQENVAKSSEENDQVDSSSNISKIDSNSEKLIRSSDSVHYSNLNDFQFDKPSKIEQGNDNKSFKLDFFDETMMNNSRIGMDQYESDTKPKYQFVNKFGNEIPLIPRSFKNRKDDGFLWRWTGFKCIQNLLDRKSNRHRPIFTYWLMFLEIIIFMLIIAINGTGYFGFQQKRVSDIVWHQSNSYQPATYTEPKNIWYGPTPSVLIRLGSIFTPCMRNEKLTYDNMERVKQMEKDSGCCLRMDNSGCVQTQKSKCSKKTSYFLKNSNKPGPVCGQDPNYCSDNVGKKWPQNITDWPICNQKNLTFISKTNDYHMKCKVKARPCCIGIYGKCIMASREYCDFMKGTFNPKATLCSQVSCMNDVCGLTRFKNEPNQRYRLILSLFLHAGVIQILISIIMQHFFMSVLEETYGTRKIILLYFISGVGGNLASSIFLPLTPEIGPMSTFFGLLSLLIYLNCIPIAEGWCSLDTINSEILTLN
ncbi:Inactive rhomboid protein 2 [Blomia tropicalis]|nr:Inactive rhomboid protein 2 [Blomia tropicalis]